MGTKKTYFVNSEAGLARHLPEEYVKDSICHACYALLSNDKIRTFLQALAHDPEFRRKAAYARLYYLGESRMFEFMKSELLEQNVSP
jgi:hypothetical protein